MKQTLTSITKANENINNIEQLTVEYQIFTDYRKARMEKEVNNHLVPGNLKVMRNHIFDSMDSGWYKKYLEKYLISDDVINELVLDLWEKIKEHNWITNDKTEWYNKVYHQFNKLKIISENFGLNDIQTNNVYTLLTPFIKWEDCLKDLNINLWPDANNDTRNYHWTAIRRIFPTTPWKLREYWLDNKIRVSNDNIFMDNVLKYDTHWVLSSISSFIEWISLVWERKTDRVDIIIDSILTKIWKTEDKTEFRDEITNLIQTLIPKSNYSISGIINYLKRYKTIFWDTIPFKEEKNLLLDSWLDYDGRQFKDVQLNLDIDVFEKKIIWDLLNKNWNNVDAEFLKVFKVFLPQKPFESKIISEFIIKNKISIGYIDKSIDFDLISFSSAMENVHWKEETIEYFKKYLTKSRNQTDNDLSFQIWFSDMIFLRNFWLAKEEFWEAIVNSWWNYLTKENLQEILNSENWKIALKEAFSKLETDEILKIVPKELIQTIPELTNLVAEKFAKADVDDMWLRNVGDIMLLDSFGILNKDLLGKIIKDFWVRDINSSSSENLSYLIKKYWFDTKNLKDMRNEKLIILLPILGIDWLDVNIRESLNIIESLLRNDETLKNADLAKWLLLKLGNISNEALDCIVQILAQKEPDTLLPLCELSDELFEHIFARIREVTIRKSPVTYVFEMWQKIKEWKDPSGRVFWEIKMFKDKFINNRRLQQAVKLWYQIPLDIISVSWDADHFNIDLLNNTDFDVNKASYTGEEMWKVLDSIKSIDSSNLKPDSKEIIDIFYKTDLSTVDSPRMYFSRMGHFCRAYSIIVDQHSFVNMIIKKFIDDNVSSDFVDNLVTYLNWDRRNESIFSNNFFINEKIKLNINDWRSRDFETSMLPEEIKDNLIALLKKYGKEEELFSLKRPIQDYSVYANTAEYLLKNPEKIKDPLQIISSILHRQVFYSLYPNYVDKDNDYKEYELFKTCFTNLHKRFIPSIFHTYVRAYASKKQEWKNVEDLLTGSLIKDKFAKHIFTLLLKEFEPSIFEGIENKLTMSWFKNNFLWAKDIIPRNENGVMSSIMDEKNEIKATGNLLESFYKFWSIDEIKVIYSAQLLYYLKNDASEETVSTELWLKNATSKLLENGENITALYDRVFRDSITQSKLQSITVVKKLWKILTKDQFRDIVQHINKLKSK